MTCLICGSGSTDAVWRGVTDYEYATYHAVDYVRCAQCGAIRQLPLPDVALIPSFYPSDYRNHLSTGSGGFFPILKNMQTRRLAKRLGRVIGRREAKILELGCGSGALLMAFKELGFRDLSGSDFDSAAEEPLVSAGIRFRPANIEKGFPFSEKFDAVIMVNVVEHFLDPAAVLRAVGEHLSTDGKIILITPNAEALELSLFGRSWSGFHAPRHVYLFSREGLRRLSGTLGFPVITLWPMSDPGQWAISLQNMFQESRIFRSRLANGLGWYTPLLAVLVSPLAWLQSFWPRRSSALLAVLHR